MKPFIRHECAINSPRLKGRLENFHSQGKDRKVAQNSKAPKENNFKNFARILISWGDNPERKITKIMAKYLLQGLSAEAQPATYA